MGVKGLNDMVQSFFLFMIMEGRKLGYLHDMSLGDIGTISLLFSFLELSSFKYALFITNEYL